MSDEDRLSDADLERLATLWQRSLEAAMTFAQERKMILSALTELRERRESEESNKWEGMEEDT